MLPRTECELGTSPTVRIPMITANGTEIGLLKMSFPSMNFLFVGVALQNFVSGTYRL